MKLWKHFSFLEFISALLSHWKKVWCGLQNVLRKNDFLCRLVCGSYRNHVVPTWKVCDAYKMIGRANRMPVAPAPLTRRHNTTFTFVHRPFSNANGTPHFFQSTLFFSLFLSFSPVSLFLSPHFFFFSLPFPPFLSFSVLFWNRVEKNLLFFFCTIKKTSRILLSWKWVKVYKRENLKKGTMTEYVQKCCTNVKIKK